jgi:hypothetical protein
MDYKYYYIRTTDIPSSVMLEYGIKTKASFILFILNVSTSDIKYINHNSSMWIIKKDFKQFFYKSEFTHIHYIEYMKYLRILRDLRLSNTFKEVEQKSLQAQQLFSDNSYIDSDYRGISMINSAPSLASRAASIMDDTRCGYNGYHFHRGNVRDMVTTLDAHLDREELLKKYYSYLKTTFKSEYRDKTIEMPDSQVETQLLTLNIKS